MECFCGNERPKSFLKLEDENCHMECTAKSSQDLADDHHKYCGGYLTMSVFETGMFNCKYSTKGHNKEMY